MKQFVDVNGNYGAPMGRATFGSLAHFDPVTDVRPIELFRVNLDNGGYDDGGAYWGAGPTLFCARSRTTYPDTDYRQFVRAANRFDAAALLGFGDDPAYPRLLARGLLSTGAIPGPAHVYRLARGVGRWIVFLGTFPVSEHETRAGAEAGALNHRRRTLESMTL